MAEARHTFQKFVKTLGQSAAHNSQTKTQEESWKEVMNLEETSEHSWRLQFRLEPKKRNCEERKSQ